MLDGVPRPVLNDSPQIHPLGAGLISLPYVLYAFEQLLGSGLLEEFPRLRVGFLEAGAEWTTRLVKSLRRRTGGKVDQWLGERVFVACRLDDDIPYLVNQLGDDFLVTGTDFPHEDAFRQDQVIAGLAERGDLADATVEKILSVNPQRLWRLPQERAAAS
jgi:predicted TIM-barrel fold metal-dependent hydrolase